jgi:hypothetical protein
VRPISQLLPASLRQIFAENRFMGLFNAARGEPTPEVREALQALTPPEPSPDGELIQRIKDRLAAADFEVLTFRLYSEAPSRRWRASVHVHYGGLIWYSGESELAALEVLAGEMGVSLVGIA